MAWEPSLLSVLLFFAAGILALIAVSGWRRRGARATPFVALMSAAAAWAALYGVQLGFSTAAEQIPWQAAVLTVSAAIPVTFLAFAYQYAGERERVAGWPLRLAVGEAVAFGSLAVTNPWHHLVWSDATLRAQLSPVLVLDFAVGYVVHILVAYALVGFALWALVSVYVQSSAIYRKQSALLLAGVLPALGCHILWSLRASPVTGLDLTPFAFVFTGATFGAALFHFDLLDRTPVAREHAIELTGDGLFVVDTAGLVVDSNSIARRVFEFDSGDRIDVSTITDVSDVQDLDGETMAVTVDGVKRTYDLFVSELPPDSTELAGYSVVLRDVTDRDAYERRLEVAYRVLRHNLRNDMNVVIGRAETLEALATTDEQASHAAKIQSAGAGLVSLSEKVRQMVDLGSGEREHSEQVDAVSVLEDVLEEFRAAYPDVPVTVESPAAAPVTVLSRHALSVALENVLENAPEHNDVESLAVTVEITTTTAETRVEISDTGSGMPALEREVLQNDRETPLEHSNGLGLWLTSWIVDHSGGDLAVETSESAGTTVVLAFPR